MPELTPHVVDTVLAVCTAGAAEAAAALGRALDAPLSLEVGQPGAWRTAPPGEFGGAGLALVFRIGSSGAAIILPADSGLLPAWCPRPDLTGQSKLATLAQELGIVMLPEDFMPDDSKPGWVSDLAAAMSRGGVPDDAVVIPCKISVGDEPRGVAALIWPLANPGAVLVEPAADEVSSPVPSPPVERPARVPPRPAKRSLPPYTRSLLRITVPVLVTLAEKRQPLGKIVELGPGSIIHFDKSCEEMLELSVGNCRIARGEAVKVGDKFGLRITSITPPGERFVSVRAKRNSSPAP